MTYVWMTEALKYKGLKEIPGPGTNETIKKWLSQLKAWWSDDETPWCGVFVAHCMRHAGYDIPKHWYRAKAWLDWGIPISEPVPGCIVVFGRKGGGHVGFVVGRDLAGNLLVLGGNQSNSVNVMAFDRRRVEGYRVPNDVIIYPRPLPLYNAKAAISTNEA